MDCGANRDLLLLQDEKFDFDVSLSPASSKGDDEEDEVFVGPVSHTERCVARNIESEQEECSTWVSWSPLTGDQLDAVCQEAHRLASQLQTGEPHGGCTETTTISPDTTTAREVFVQDAEAKLGMLGKTASVLSPIKRQTFCVQDSPMKQLPPTIQRQMLRGSSSSTALSTHPTTRLGSSSPLVRARTQPRAALSGRASLGITIVLPSKPVAPPTSCSVNKSKMERTRLQPQSKVTGALRQSTSSRLSIRAESSEDLASVASDISDSSTSSSLLRKHTLAPPTKQSVRARNLSNVRALPPQSRRMTDRRNTSSSSSSVSSFNSSLSLSPTKGKLNSSLNRNPSTSSGPASSRPASQSRARRSTACNAAEPVSSGVGRRSLSTQVKKLSEAERVGAIKSTPVKRAQTTPLQPTPSRRLLERSASISTVDSGQLQNEVKSKPVLPAPHAAGSADSGSKVLKSKRLVAANSVDSLPVKLSAGPLTPSVGGSKPQLVAPRRPSALPTPVKRRTSAIPAPSSHTRTVRSPALTNITPTSAAARRVPSCSPVPRDTQEEQPFDPPEIQPFCLEEEELGNTLPSKTQEPLQTEEMDLRAPTETESAPTRSLIRLEPAEESLRKPQEVLLLDLSPPNLQPQEKLLIDLTNTPELTHPKNKSCTTTQLIDLSSPLIKWSPEEKKENAVPLINLSF